MRNLLIILLFGLTAAFAQNEGDFTAGEFTFKLNDAWKAGKPSSSMSAGAVTHKATDVSANAFYFGPGNGGGVPANIDRWKGQFEGGPTADKVEKKDMNGTTVHIVSLDGTFNVGAMFGPKVATPDYSMLAGILEGKKGAVFIKLTGPKDKVAALRGDFEGLLQEATKPAK